MKRIKVFLAVLLSVVSLGARGAPGDGIASNKSPTLYSADRDHIWNRLYNLVCLRQNGGGDYYGVEAIDPLLWLETKYLLTGKSHQQALTLLDEFLRTHAENAIQDPLKRALLQHSLWAVFDWSASRRDDFPRERYELQIRLAEVLRRLTLTEEEIKALPQNYVEAVASGTFAGKYDAADRKAKLLPFDLLQPRGPWVRVTPAFEPVAISHMYGVSGRSNFLVFIRLPKGRAATIDYLQRLWNAPEPWVASEMDRGDNPKMPQFPVGTQVALLRQMCVIDQKGTLVSTSITESLQIRGYRAITSRQDRNGVDDDWPIARKEQGFYEVRLRASKLFAKQQGGLEAVEQEMTESPTFQTQGWDAFESTPATSASLKTASPSILDRCVGCHSASGIHSVQSRSKLLKPNRTQLDVASGNDPNRITSWAWWEFGDNLSWKEQRYDWGLLNGYWLSKGPR